MFKRKISYKKFNKIIKKHYQKNEVIHKGFGDINTKKDLCYFENKDDDNLYFDIIWSPEHYNGRTIIYFKGGLNEYNSKNDNVNYLSYFASNGFKIISFDIAPLNNKKGNNFDLIIRQLNSLFKIIFANKIKYKIDIKNIYFLSDFFGSYYAFLFLIASKNKEASTYFKLDVLNEFNIVKFAAVSPIFNLDLFIDKLSYKLNEKCMDIIFGDFFDNKNINLYDPSYYINNCMIENMFLSSCNNDKFRYQYRALLQLLDDKKVPYINHYCLTSNSNISNSFNRINSTLVEGKNVNEKILEYFSNEKEYIKFN